MSQGMRKLRSATNTGVLVSAGALSHHAAGGSFIALAPAAFELAILAALVYLFSRKSLEGPKLAVLIVLAQSISHMAMGGDNKAGLPMALSHIGAGVLSYFYICNSEKFWNSLAEKFITYFQRFAFVLHVVNTRILTLTVRAPERLKSHLFQMRLNWRGPPVLN